MEFICKKTSDLSDDELCKISILFESVFKKERSVDFLLHQYVHNVLGYSFHSIIKDDDRIVGLNSYVPAYFWYKGEKILFTNSIDSMVDKPYRDYFNYQDIVETAFKYMKKEHVDFVYGYPNDNAYPVLCKSKLMDQIGRMRTYCLPYRIGGIRSSLKLLNGFSRMFCDLYVWGCGLFASSKVATFLLAKDLDSYNETRYKRNDGQYKKFGKNQYGFVYKIVEYENIRSVFLIDVYPKSPKAFNRSIRYLLKEEKKNFDLILYPGYLPFKNTSLIELPENLEPKKFNFMGLALNPKLKNKEVFTIKNWDTNLSNYDLI